MALTVGQQIQVPCEIAEGAFPGERLITIDTKIGPVSGFVKERDIQHTSTGGAYLVGVIEDMDGDTISVRLQGSFFRTTGIAYFNKDMLRLCA